MAKSEEPSSSVAGKKKGRADEDPLPPDAGTKPIQLQRRRVWRACESCRRKKIKCDGCEPTCSQCSASGSQCTWLQTKDRAALSRHYVQELEARLLHMESLFQQLTPALTAAGHTIDINGLANNTSSLPASITSLSKPEGASNDSEPSPPRSESDANSNIDDEFTESFGQLALDEYGHMRWIGGSSTMSLIQSFKALTTNPIHRVSPMEEDPQDPGPSVNKLYFPAAVFFGKVRALPGPEEVEFPPRDLADKLVEAYFSRLHYLMPVIDKPSFLSKYRYLMDNANNHTVIRNEAPFLGLMFSLFASAVTLVKDPRLDASGRHDDGGMGMVYYERALILQYISHANIQIAHVQCLILMSSFLCSVNCLPQAWILIGQAVRTGQDLGLHRSPRRMNVQNIEKETRKKVWWGVYVLDRMLAVALGRPLGVHDPDCDVELPADVDDENLQEYYKGTQLPQPSLMAGFIFMIKLYEIGGRMLRQVYALDVCREHLEREKKAELQRTVEKLDNELTKWCNDLPAVYKTQPQKDEQASMGIVLCSHYYSLVTTLHRNFLPVKRDESVTAKSTLKAVSTARHCIKLAPSFHTLVPPSHHLAFFIQNLFSSAVIVLLFSMHTSDVRGGQVTMDEARSTIVAVEAWEGQWPGARKCKELLIEIIKTASEAMTKGQHEMNNGSAAGTTPTSPSRHERRRSVTIGGATTSTIPSASGRVVKPRTRRNQSRDPGQPSSRRMAAVSPYRVDSAQRARSSSRRRHYDEDGEPRSANPIYQAFPSPVQASNSPHSSPGSVNLPSPSMAVLDQPKQQQQQQQAQPQSQQQPQQLDPHSLSGNNYNNFQSPISPNSPFDYTPNSLTQSNLQQWAGSNGEFGPQQDPSLFNHQYAGFSMDTGFGGYDPGSDLTNPLSSLSTTPPSSTFAATGLPFNGLDYIRNFRSGGYSASDQDALWQTYDPNGFYEHELSFNLGEQQSNNLIPENLR